MPEIKRGAASNILRFTLKNSSTGVGLTGLTSSSTGLIISTICDNEATATVYTVTAGNVETITTLGTYAAPTSGKCRFKEVDAANHKGLYEFQFADARFSVASSKRLVISVTGATSLLDADYEITLVDNVAADAYGIVNHASYGNAQLVRSTAPANTLDVSATGEAGLDFNNIKDATGAKTLTNITVPTVSTLTGHTAQTGDSYALANGANGFAAIKGDTAATLAESQSHPTLAEMEATTVLAKEATLTNATYGLSALNTDLDALLTRLSALRAGYLDNLNTGVPLSAASVDAILDEVVEGSLTLRQMMRIMLASLAGKSSGGGTATLLFKGADGTTTRITATVDADGNRTAITVSGT